MEKEISIKVRQKLVERMADALFDVCYKSRICVHAKDVDYSIAQCFLQIFVMRTRSILKLAEGVKYSSASDLLLVDPISMYPIFRSFYEHYVVFHSLFVKEKDKDVRELLVLLWEIFGESNKIRLEKLPKKFESYQNVSCQQIEEMKAIAVSKIAALNATKRVKNNLKNKINPDVNNTTNVKNNSKDKIKPGFKKLNHIVFERDKNGIIYEYKAEDYVSYAKYIFKDEKLVDIYNVLSIESHPTDISVKQFGQMFNKKELCDELLKKVLDGCLILLKEAIASFVDVFECKELLKCLAIDIKDILAIKL